MCKWRINVILITNCSYFVKVPSWLKRCSIWCTPFKNRCLQKTYLLLIHIDSLNHIRLKRDSSLSVHFLSSKNGTKTSFQNRFLKVLKIDIVIFFQEVSYLKHLEKYLLTWLTGIIKHLRIQMVFNFCIKKSRHIIRSQLFITLNVTFGYSWCFWYCLYILYVIIKKCFNFLYMTERSFNKVQFDFCGICLTAYSNH